MQLPKGEHANYARVYMGAQLNISLRIWVSSRSPKSLSYVDIKDTLSKHFDGQRKKYVERVKFRQLKQEVSLCD